MTLDPRLARLAATLAATLATIVLVLAPCAVRAQSAATFIVAIGAVQVVDAGGRTRQAERGGALAPGDRVVTGSNGLAQIRFSDGAMLSVRADSDLKIDAYSFRGESDTLATTVLQLVRGGLRAITGAVARIHRSGYKVVTPTATIGVRGTDFEAFHIPPPGQGGATLPGEPGTYLRVSRGVAFLQTSQSILDVQPQQVGFVPLATITPRLLPQTPQFMLPPSRPAPGPAPAPGPSPNSQPPQRSEGGTSGPEVRQAQPGGLQQIEPSRTLTAPTVNTPTTSPGLTSPTTVSPTLTAPGTAPILTGPTTAPTLNAPTTSPTLSPGITNPATISPSMTAPATTAPLLSPQMTAPPPTVAPPR
jgi:FecR protein